MADDYHIGQCREIESGFNPTLLLTSSVISSKLVTLPLFKPYLWNEGSNYRDGYFKV